MGSKAGEGGGGGLGFYNSTASSSSAVEVSVDVAREWRNAQAILLSVTPDIVSAAKIELQFLADMNAAPSLLRAGPTLDHAIHRYEHCWLPLLASERSKDDVSPLVPPLDCAWVWHCHRLNPIQYVEDCKRLYGKLLGAHCIEPSTILSEATKELWRQHYPSEEYHLQLPWTPRPGAPQFEKKEKGIEYDLTGAVTRQSSFYYQVSESFVKEESYLHSAEQRYKGFLYLFAKIPAGTFLVPTYDIDLMWHTHQLDPVAYNRDLLVLTGKLLPHDDTDDNREEGARLRTGFQDTKRLWEETFGSPYEKAGVMYRGSSPKLPSPCSQPENVMFGTTYLKLREDQRQHLIERESVQLCVNVLGVRNLRPQKTGSQVFVSMKGIHNGGDFQLTTSEVDMVTTPRWQTSPWMIHCALSTTGVVFELRVQPTGLFKSLTGSKLLGEVRLLFSTLLASPTLAIQEWYAVSHKSGPSPIYDSDTKPPALLLAASITPPISSPYLLRTINWKVQSDIFNTVKESKRAWHTGRWLTRIVLDQNSEEKYLVRVKKMKGRMKDCVFLEENEKEVQVWQRDPMKMMTKPWSLKSVEFVAAAHQIMNTQAQKENANIQREWCLLDKTTTFTVKKTQHDPHWDDNLEFELKGHVGYPVKLLSGRWLQYQVHDAKSENESGFVTVIRYTPSCPTGKATALFNWKAAMIEVSVEENVMLVILLSTITALVVNDLLGIQSTKIVKKTERKHFPRHAQWGAMVIDRRFETNAKVIYHDWWVDPKEWAKEMYARERGGYRGESGCGGGGCGGGVCAGGCGGDNGGGPYKDMLSFSADLKIMF